MCTHVLNCSCEINYHKVSLRTDPSKLSSFLCSTNNPIVVCCISDHAWLGVHRKVVVVVGQEV